MEFSIGKQTFELPDLEGETLPHLAFLTAFDAAKSFHTKKDAITGNTHLSDTGRAAQIAPLIDRLWDQILVSTENLEQERSHWNKREDELFAVGSPESSNEISRESEIRAWWRNQSADVRLKIMKDVEAGPEHAELVRALLRSPVPDSIDLEKRHFRELHNQIVRLDNPGEWMAIESGRRALDWAQRGMGHVVGISYGATGWDGSAVLRQALKTGREMAAGVMFDAKEVAMARNVLSAQRHMTA